jgi:hypothetical protein
VNHFGYVQGFPPAQAPGGESSGGVLRGRQVMFGLYSGYIQAIFRCYFFGEYVRLAWRRIAPAAGPRQLELSVGGDPRGGETLSGLTCLKAPRSCSLETSAGEKS